MWKVENKYLDIAVYALAGFMAAFFASFFLSFIGVKSATVFYIFVWVINFIVFYQTSLFLLFLLLGRAKEFYFKKEKQLSSIKVFLVNKLKKQS